MRKTLRRWAVLAAVVGVATLGACGTDANPQGGGDAGDDSIDIDNCSLLTNEEVSALAGYELDAGEDSALGCGFAEPDATIADFSIRAYRQSGDAAARAAELAPSLEIVPLSGVGDDAVALADSDGQVNFLVARKGNLFVELVMTFLDVETGSPELDEAGQLASTALDRLAGMV